MVSFGQGCEGEPLLRWKEIARAIRLIRAATPRGSIHANTNGSLPEALGALCDAGLDSVRVSLNSAAPDLYAAYYRPRGYGLHEVIRSVEAARRKRRLRRAQPAHLPRRHRPRRRGGGAGPAGARRAGWTRCRPGRSPSTRTSTSAMARGRGAGGPALGIRRLVRRSRRRGRGWWWATSPGPGPSGPGRETRSR